MMGRKIQGKRDSEGPHIRKYEIGILFKPVFGIEFLILEISHS